MRKLAYALVSIVASVFVLAPAASASTIQCCTISSDATPAAQLDATFDFQVTGAVLTLTVDNDTLAPNEFNINQIYFDATASVTSLSLSTATHSFAGDVTSDWAPVLTNQMPDGFSVMDFGLADGMGEMDPSVIQPGENIAFVFSINGGVGTFTDADFGPLVAAKFVNGPSDPEPPFSEDSAFGTVPEPSTAVLLSLGLVGLSARRRLAQRSGCSR
jgi:hypothetical protein